MWWHVVTVEHVDGMAKHAKHHKTCALNYKSLEIIWLLSICSCIGIYGPMVLYRSMGAIICNRHDCVVSSSCVPMCSDHWMFASSLPSRLKAWVEQPMWGVHASIMQALPASLATIGSFIAIDVIDMISHSPSCLGYAWAESLIWIDLWEVAMGRSSGGIHPTKFGQLSAALLTRPASLQDGETSVQHCSIAEAPSSANQTGRHAA